METSSSFELAALRLEVAALRKQLEKSERERADIARKYANTLMGIIAERRRNLGKTA